jgi:hypothetical protein
MSMIDEMAEYLATDPEGLGIEPDSTGLPAIIAGAKRKWPEATNADIGEAARLGSEMAQRRAAAFFAEADALEALAEAKRRSNFTLVDGGRR